jgi:transcriptional regulator with XRE-family HTH domain
LEEINLSLNGTIFQMKPWIKHIRELMKERGMTQEALACQLGRGQSWVNHKLSGRRKANVEDIILIARALDIEPSALLKNVTNYEKLADSFMGVAESRGTYQANWLMQVADDMEQLDDKTRAEFMEETTASLEQKLQKKGSN